MKYLNIKIIRTVISVFISNTNYLLIIDSKVLNSCHREFHNLVALCDP